VLFGTEFGGSGMSGALVAVVVGGGSAVARAASVWMVAPWAGASVHAVGCSDGSVFGNGCGGT